MMVDPRDDRSQLKQSGRTLSSQMDRGEGVIVLELQ